MTTGAATGYRRVVTIYAAAGCALIVVAVARVVASDLTLVERIAGTFFLGLWNCAPLALWGRWSYGWANESVERRASALAVGALLGIFLVLFHAYAWDEIHASSTGGLAYVSGPVGLLILTTVGMGIASRI